nr:hypothetical protein [Tanacetum cinerariifolium]
MVDVMVVWVVSDGGGCGGEWVMELAAWWRGDVGWVKMGDVDGVEMVTVEMAWCGGGSWFCGGGMMRMMAMRWPGVGRIGGDSVFGLDLEQVSNTGCFIFGSTTTVVGLSILATRGDNLTTRIQDQDSCLLTFVIKQKAHVWKIDPIVPVDPMVDLTFDPVDMSVDVDPMVDPTYDQKQIADQEILFDKISRQLVELDENVRMLQNKVLEKDLKIFDLEECVRNKDLEIEKSLERLNECENKIHKIGQTNPTIQMIMSSKNKLYNGRKRIDFEKIDSLFQQTSSLKPYVPNVILEKIIIDLEDEVVSLLDNEKENLKIIESLKSKGFESSENATTKLENQSENDCQVVEKDCDHLENSNVIAPGMFALNVSRSVSHISVSKTSCASNNVEKNKKKKTNAYSNARMNAYDDVNDLFVFDNESLRKSKVSKMPFRKKPRASLNMHSRSKLNKSLPKIVLRWLPKTKPLAEPVAKWILRVKRCSKHMTGNHALLMNFMKKYLRTVRFRNNNFAVIAGYGDGLEVAFPKSICFVRNENGIDFLTDDRSSNLYYIALDEITSNSLDFLLAKASSSQSWLCYLLNDYDDDGKLKAKEDIGVFVGYSKGSAAFRVYNKRTYKIYESVNVNFDEISEMASKQFSLEPGLSNLNETEKSSNLTVPQEEETSKKDLEDLFHNFYDEYFDASKINKSPTTNVKTLHEREVFHEVFESFQPKSSSSSLNNDVQQSPEAIIVPPTNTQSISNDMIPNVNVENETKWTKDHPLHKIIGDPKSNVRTRGQLANSCLFACLLSSIEPANVAEALKDVDWVIAMQDDLDQFARLKVRRLVSKPESKTIIKTKWIFKNKKNKSSLVIQNKARLLAVGYCQQEGIDYDETFALVAQIEAIH